MSYDNRGYVRNVNIHEIWWNGQIKTQESKNNFSTPVISNHNHFLSYQLKSSDSPHSNIVFF